MGIRRVFLIAIIVLATRGIRSNATTLRFTMQLASMKSGKNIYLLQRLGKLITAKVPAEYASDPWQWIADKTSIPLADLQKLPSGEFDPTLIDLLMIAAAFNMQLSTLLEGL